MEKRTEWQLQVMLAWMDEKWEQPDLLCWYVMALICEVRRLFQEDPSSVQPADCKLRFTKETPPVKEGEEAPELTEEQVAMIERQFMGLVGGRFNPRGDQPPAQ